MNIGDHKRLALVESQAKLLYAASVAGWGINLGILFVPAILAGSASGVGEGFKFFFGSLLIFLALCIPLGVLADEASKKHAEHKANKAWAAEQERIQLNKFFRDLS